MPRCNNVCTFSFVGNASNVPYDCDFGEDDFEPLYFCSFISFSSLSLSLGGNIISFLSSEPSVSSTKQPSSFFLFLFFRFLFDFE